MEATRIHDQALLYAKDPTFLFFLSSTIPAIFLIIKGFPLFFSHHNKHLAHRFIGLFFLIFDIFSWYLFLYHNDVYFHYKCGPIIGVLGVLQAVTAAISFHFLKDSETPGSFFGDKGLISKSFIRENIFFQMMTLFGFLYWDADIRQWMSSNPFGIILECTFVFLPYIILRPLFPTTRFRSAYPNVKNVSSQANQKFYEIGIMVIKFFYLGSKHMVGHGLNYMVFLNLISINVPNPESPTFYDDIYLPGVVLANASTVSFSIFLHTLKFKKLLDPRLSYSIYVFLAYVPFLGILKLVPYFLQFKWISLIALVGMGLNFFPKKVWATYQFAVCFFFLYLRFQGQERILV